MHWFWRAVIAIRKATKVFLVLLPIALAIVWPCSYSERIDLPGFDSLNYPDEPTGGELFVRPRFEKGRLWFRCCQVIPGASLQEKSSGPHLGFYHQRIGDNRYKAGTFVERRVYLPIWFLILLTLPYPIAIFVRGPYPRYRRRKRGLCLKCGYDLTGNVSGVCPECGEQI